MQSGETLDIYIYGATMKKDRSITHASLSHRDCNCAPLRYKRFA